MKLIRRRLPDTVGALALTVAAAFCIAGSPAVSQRAHAQESAPEATVDVKALMDQSVLPDIALGKADAPVTIVEYASMTCSHCAAFHAGTWPALKKDFIETGKVRFIFRAFPLDPVATAATMLMRCAPQDKYYDMVDLFFDNQKDWAFVQDPLSGLLSMAKQAGFTQMSFEACLSNQKLLDQINTVKETAYKQFGVNATPTFFLNGQKLTGEQSIDAFAKAIDAAAAKAGPAN
ncbi:DsbA family protein [Pseudoxanthobacter sp.]|uniref:DsbA family protein n=1 Tax=Pseudoxanthobacter sp. TaxID=1925742 RepID=UPI002FE27CCF